jgi:hypothetical protein
MSSRWTMSRHFYVKADLVLDVCNASLSAALQHLIASTDVAPRA